jgi:hypothetical protein
MHRSNHCSVSARAAEEVFRVIVIDRGVIRNIKFAGIGATIRPAGDRLILRAGRTALPTELVGRIRAAKTNCLAVLSVGADIPGSEEARTAYLGKRSLPHTHLNLLQVSAKASSDQLLITCVFEHPVVPASSARNDDQIKPKTNAHMRIVRDDAADRRQAAEAGLRIGRRQSPESAYVTYGS